MRVITYSPEETVALGKAFARMVKEGDTVILKGTLGSGKTTFMRGVAKGFGCRKRVASPSFTLVRQYKGRKGMLYHIDLYRLSGRQLFSFGLEDYLDDHNARVFIEWGEKIEAMLRRYIRVEFFFHTETGRRIVFSAREEDGRRCGGRSVQGKKQDERSRR